ncbi:hypothetical protein [Bacteroides sp. 51]|uniref:hypothetical protein n=1 Tax=Bacteroides sp. 51 TaxID=2302938 RepID=UPI0013CF9D8D|nr:hypothetical protein [Bacteroides sp. 51]NDV83376.1 hypothetical protein [Bacteroides sp. 51]
MDSTKRNYTVITKQISDYNGGNNNNTDVYVYTYIKLCSDYKTGVSHIRECKISENTDIPEDTVSNIICRLKQFPSLFEVKTTRISGNKNINTYHFDVNPENYYFIDNRYFYLKLDTDTNTEIKIKGFLLLLKSICLNGTNLILTEGGKNGKPNISKIADRLHQDRSNVKKLLEHCIEFQLIEEISNGYYILNDCFLLTVKDSKENEIYNTIYEYCLSKGVIPPKRDLKAIKVIKLRYRISDKELASIPEETKNKKQLTETYSLFYNLNLRCSNLPTYVQMNYFTEALLNRTVKKKTKIEHDLTF